MKWMKRILKYCHTLYENLYAQADGAEAGAIPAEDTGDAAAASEDGADGSGEQSEHGRLLHANERGTIGSAGDAVPEDRMSEPGLAYHADPDDLAGPDGLAGMTGTDDLAGLAGLDMPEDRPQDAAHPAPGNSPHAVLETWIEELDFSVRTYNCLKRAGLHTVGDIAAHSQSWLLHNVRNWGKKSMEEVEAKLLRLHICLPAGQEDGAEPAVKPEPSALEILEGLVGLGEVKERMKDLTAHCAIRKLKNEICGTAYPLAPNMVFLGNPGTGKTTVAKLAARTFREIGLMRRGHLVSVTRSDLVAEYVGQSAAQTTRIFESALDGVLFVDEAYALFHKLDGERAGDSFSCEVIDTLCALMSEYAGRCCVILAGYAEEMDFMLEQANPGLRERFPFRLHFADYSETEMQRIFLLKAAERKLILSDECVRLMNGAMSRLCTGKGRGFANGRLVDNYLQELVLRQERRLFDQKREGAELGERELLTLLPEDFDKAEKSLPGAVSQPPARRAIGFAGAA